MAAWMVIAQKSRENINIQLKTKDKKEKQRKTSIMLILIRINQEVTKIIHKDKQTFNNSLKV